MSAAEPLRLTLRVGETTEVGLDDLATAGFRWEHRVEGPDGVVLVSRRRDPPPERSVGRSAPDHLVVEARTVGRVLVHLDQRRAWEVDRPPRVQRLLEVEVVE